MAKKKTFLLALAVTLQLVGYGSVLGVWFFVRGNVPLGIVHEILLISLCLALAVQIIIFGRRLGLAANPVSIPLQKTPSSQSASEVQQTLRARGSIFSFASQ